MKPSRPLDPRVQQLIAEAQAADGTLIGDQTSAQHDPALLKAIAEASAWIVLLHGPDRDAAVDQGFKRWLDESSVHKYAFEHVTETWDNARSTVRQGARLDISAPGDSRPRPVRRLFYPMAAVAASLAIVVVAALLHLHERSVITGIGERRTIVLDDGTQVTLNTATSMTVDYGKDARRIQLLKGEACFEVAKAPHRPFIVNAGGRQVMALGTTFVVRRDDERVAVILVEGSVAVSSTKTASGSTRAMTELGKVNPTLSRSSTSAGTDSGTTLLTPGQRIVFAGDEAPRLDQPQLEKLTAWQQGLVNFDDVALAQAAEEMNRYNTTKIVVSGPAAHIRVSGVFRVTDTRNFVQAVALTHGLVVSTRDGVNTIVLSGAPQAPGEALFQSYLEKEGEQR